MPAEAAVSFFHGILDLHLLRRRGLCREVGDLSGSLSRRQLQEDSERAGAYFTGQVTGLEGFQRKIRNFDREVPS